MKSIANKILYSLNGTFKFIGKELGHLYELIKYIWVTVTGTNLTLNNTIEAPMRINLNSTAISQTTYTGKNLLNVYDYNTISSNYMSIDSDGWISANCTNSGSSTIFLNLFTNINSSIEANTNYSLVCEIKSISYTGSGGYLSIASSNNNYAIPGVSNVYINNLTSNSIIINSVTSKADLTGLTGLVRNYISVSTNSSINIKFRLSLIKGSVTESTFTYEPYVGGTASPNPSYPQDIHTISGNNSVVVDNGNGVSQTAPIDLGKNLFDKNNAYVSGNNNQDIAIQLNNLKVGTKYKFYANEKVWLKILTYDSNNTLKRTLGNTNQTKVIEFYPQSGETSFYFSFYAQNNVDISTYDFTNVYIYEYTYELNKIGDYQDKIFKNILTDEDYSSERDEGGWYYKQGIGKVVLDGSETIYDDWQNPSQTNTRQYYLKSSFLNNNYVPSTSSNITAMTNYFKCITHTIWNYDDERFALNDSTTYSVQFKISNTTAPTLADFKTWLSTHNTIIYYELATPTYTKITGTLETQLENIYKNMLSYSGQTNISQINNDLPFTLDVSAIEVQ